MMISKIHLRPIVLVSLTMTSEITQAFLASRYNFRGPYHPLLLFIFPMISLFFIDLPLLRRLASFTALSFLGFFTFCFAAECFGTFS